MRLRFYFFQPFSPLLGVCIFTIFGRFGHFWAAAFLLFWAFLGHSQTAAFFFLAVFANFRPFWPFSVLQFVFFLALLANYGRLRFIYFRPFWHASRSCSFFFFGCFGHSQGAAFLFFFDCFGDFPVPAFLVHWDILPLLGRPHSNGFRLFLAILRGQRFSIFGHFGNFWGIQLLLFPAVLAIFRQLHSCYFRPFWPFSGGLIFIISTIVAIFWWLHCYYFRLFRQFSGSCISVLFGRFGHSAAAAFLLLSIFRCVHFDHFLPVWPFSGGCILRFTAGLAIFGRFSHSQAAAFLLFSAVQDILRRLLSFCAGLARFGLSQAATFSCFTASLAIVGGFNYSHLMQDWALSKFMCKQCCVATKGWL